MKANQFNHKYVRSRKASSLPKHTALPDFTGKRVALVVDDDNLRISLKCHHTRLSYNRLLKRIKHSAKSVNPIAILTAPEEDIRRTCYFENRGWCPLHVAHQIVPSVRGPLKKANADMDIAFEAGRLAAADNFDIVIIGTGDGDLGTAIARGLRRSTPEAHVYVLAVPGATSSRLSGPRDSINGSVAIGRDLTWPTGHRLTHRRVQIRHRTQRVQKRSRKNRMRQASN